MQPGCAPLPLRVFDSRAEAERTLADEIEELVRSAPACVLGLATGTTPVGTYQELARRHREARLSFARATSFNLDEYLGLEPDHPSCFAYWMKEQLFRHIDLSLERAHIPRCDLAPAAAAAEAGRYERALQTAGGIDLQILGIGRNGHIGFNEPGSARDTRTRLVELDPSTRADAARAFGELEHVPTQAITMGVATILAARRVRVLAFGAAKAAIVARTLSEAPSAALPAAWLREHHDVRLYVDRELAWAAGL